jgi:phosphoribosylanthranilate isomerase
LHGNETPEMCEELSAEVEVIKAFRIPGDKAIDIDEMVADYDAVCDFYLFDTAGLKKVLVALGNSLIGEY